MQCPVAEALPCAELSPACLECSFPAPCQFAQTINYTCTAPLSLNCTGPRTVQLAGLCSFCFQLPASQIVCSQSTTCDTGSAQQFYAAACSPLDDVLCLGNRTFSAQRQCNWSSGHKYSVALLLSMILGGFGADRFYLGWTASALGKLFSLGGFGVWTIIDVILIGAQYLGPADGSVYLDA